MSTGHVASTQDTADGEIIKIRKNKGNYFRTGRLCNSWHSSNSR